MGLLQIKPTDLDRSIAESVAKYTNPDIEAAARFLTWGADEHLLLLAAGVAWLATRTSTSLPHQKLGSHLLVTSIVASILPHVLKAGIDQKRPDRESSEAHRHGVHFSGRANDAFPSGHAIHMGAAAGAATLLPPRKRDAVWLVAGLLSATRIAILAHWASDVVVGFAVGAGVERLIRRMTKPMHLSVEGEQDGKAAG